MMEIHDEDGSVIKVVGTEEGTLEEELGLMFDRRFIRGIHRRQEIVMVGDANSLKTELIEAYFNTPEHFSKSAREKYDFYEIHFERMKFDLLIYDIKVFEFLTSTEFREETVFLFCYDVDNPETFNSIESRWFDAFIQRYLKRMFYFTVGIEAESHADLEQNAREQREEMKNQFRERALELINNRDLAIDCCLQDHESVRSVFQTALDCIFPLSPIS